MTWLRTHPLAGFILLAYGISYLFGVPFLLVMLAWAPAASPPLHTYVSRLFVVYGPGLAALTLAYVGSASGGDARAMVRLLRPTVHDVPWTLGVVAAATAAAMFALLLSGVPLSTLREVVASAYPLLLAHFALQLTIVATGEELGWRGWLLPALLRRSTRLRATLIVAVVWGLWHMPLLLSSVLSAVMFLVGVTGLSLIFTWLWSHTGGRLFVVVVAHAAVNTPVFFWEQVSGRFGISPVRVVGVWYSLEALYAAIGLILLLTRWNWWHARALSHPAHVPS